MMRYCFLGGEYVGRMYFLPDGMRMDWRPDGELSGYARRYKFYVPLGDDGAIRRFIGERCISPERPDRAVWLRQIGLGVDASNLDIFLASHGTSVNDVFWVSDRLDNSLWEDGLRQLFGV